MRNIIKKMMAHIKEFIDPTPKPSAISLRKNQLVQLILKAQKENFALHVIYQDKSFIGHISKYDPINGKLILKNMTSKVTAIIDMDQLQKISLMPKTISKAQSKLKKTD